MRYSIATMPRLAGRHAFLDQLVAEGVTYVFGNPGTTEQAFMDALQDYPQIQYILALHEATALAMADGYARGTGRPAFVQLHITPGLGNAMGMLFNAYRTRAPLVIYAGQHPQRGAIQEPILYGDMLNLARPVTKWAVEVQDAADIPTVVRRAFKVALDHPRGPVFIAIPANVMDEEADVQILPASDTYSRVRPDPQAIDRAVEMLANAQSPIIICGYGVATAGAAQEVARLAQLLGAPVFSAFAAVSPFPSDHPLFAGLLNVVSNRGLRQQLASADVILAVGTSVFPLLFPLEEPPFPEKTQVIHIDSEAWEIGKNWPVSLGVLADPKLALQDLLAPLEGSLTPQGREAAQRRFVAFQAMKEQLLQAMDAAVQDRWDNRPMPPARLMKELAEAIDPATLVYDEAITAGGYLTRYLRFGEGGQHFRAVGGGLGNGMPSPLGLKLARPDRPVLTVVGDGSALYTIQALWTAARYRIPITYVIVNNASYRILKLNLLEYLGEAAAGRRFVALDLDEPSLDFARIAAAFGVKGQRIEDPAAIVDAVREAQGAGEPRLLDVVVDGSIQPRGF